MPWVWFPAYPKFFQWKKIVNVASVNQWLCLEENGQRLENVYQAHLMLAKWQAGTTNKVNGSKNVLVMFSLPLSVWITLFPFIMCPFNWSGFTGLASLLSVIRSNCSWPSKAVSNMTYKRSRCRALNPRLKFRKWKFEPLCHPVKQTSTVEKSYMGFFSFVEWMITSSRSCGLNKSRKICASERSIVRWKRFAQFWIFFEKISEAEFV